MFPLSGSVATIYCVAPSETQSAGLPFAPLRIHRSASKTSFLFVQCSPAVPRTPPARKYQSRRDVFIGISEQTPVAMASRKETAARDVVDRRSKKQSKSRNKASRNTRDVPEANDLSQAGDPATPLQSSTPAVHASGSSEITWSFPSPVHAAFSAHFAAQFGPRRWFTSLLPALLAPTRQCCLPNIYASPAARTATLSPVLLLAQLVPFLSLPCLALPVPMQPATPQPSEPSPCSPQTTSEATPTPSSPSPSSSPSSPSPLPSASSKAPHEPVPSSLPAPAPGPSCSAASGGIPSAAAAAAAAASSPSPPLRFPLPSLDPRGVASHYLLDAASVAVAEALAVQPGDAVLDLCAAPGGKSVCLAQRMAARKGGGSPWGGDAAAVPQVTAVDGGLSQGGGAAAAAAAAAASAAGAGSTGTASPPPLVEEEREEEEGRGGTATAASAWEAAAAASSSSPGEGSLSEQAGRTTAEGMARSTSSHDNGSSSSSSSSGNGGSHPLPAATGDPLALFPAEWAAPPPEQLEGSLTTNEVATGRRLRLLQVLRQYLPAAAMASVKVCGFDGTKWRSTQLFDKILVDAPCSSERHLLHDPREMLTWTPKRSKNCAARQLALLLAATQALRVGGRLVYSTCSLSEEENDRVVGKLLRKARVPLEVEERDWRVGERTQYGALVLPDECDGWGPMYMCSLRRVKSK